MEQYRVAKRVRSRMLSRGETLCNQIQLGTKLQNEEQKMKSHSFWHY
jgi:hypothetical protein